MQLAQEQLRELKTGKQAELERQRLVPNLVGFTKTLGYHNKSFHDQWYKIFESGESCLLEAPRGHAKSTCGAINFPLFRILQDPNVRILILSGVIADARRLVGEILLNIEQRYPLLQRTSRKWSETEAYVARTSISKDPTIRASGILGVKPGPRADLIICDDVINEENAMSPLLRAKVIMKFKKVVLPMLEPGGQILVQGTPYHYADLYAQLKAEGWSHYHYAAIQKDGTALWEERWPLDCGKRDSETCLHPGLCCLTWAREALGIPVFNCQYLCDPKGLVGRQLKLEWIENSWIQDPLPADLEYVAGVDPAWSEQTQADYMAIATVGFSPTTKTMYLVNMERHHVSFPEGLDVIENHWKQWRESRMIIESNALQGMLIAQPLIKKTLLPILPRKTVIKKVARILAMTPYFETKKLVVRRELREFIDEYLQFPDGEHDDQLDALEMAVNDIVARHISGAGQWRGSGATFGAPRGSWADRTRHRKPWGTGHLELPKDLPGDRKTPRERTHSPQ